MATIDESIVKISLDDSQFDKASNKTIKKLDELKESLQFEGAVESFKEIDKAAKKVSFAPMEKGVMAVTNQFNALYAIADTTFRRIINGGIDAVERGLKGLTIDNVTSGWSKYADKTSAVQTIMAATAKEFTDAGEQMEYVEQQLGKLNWFTDETSYSFLDMVNNIGKFTSNNIPLEQSVTAMEGISTWAAISGANVNEAGRAMYNLSQAISVGALKLQDWISIENANMGTAQFKEMAIEAGVAAGTLRDLGDGIYETFQGHAVSVENFRENLSDAWLTSEVLLATLDKYGRFTDILYEFSEATGLSATPLLAYIEDYQNGVLNLQEMMRETSMSAEELTEWLDRLSDSEMDLGNRAFRAAQEAKTFKDAVDAVKEAVSSGWMQTFEYIFGNYQEAKKLWSDLAEGLYEVFVEPGNRRNDLLAEWKELGGRTALIEGLYKLCRNLANAVEFLRETWENVFPPKTVQQLVNIAEGFNMLIDALTPGEALVRSFQNVIIAFLKVFQKVEQVAITVFFALEPIWVLLGQIVGGLIGLAGELASVFSFGLDTVFSSKTLTGLYNIIYSISSLIANLARGALVDVLSIVINIVKFVQNIFTLFKSNGGGIEGLIKAVTTSLKQLFNALRNGKGLISTIFNTISNAANTFFQLVRENGGGIKGVITAISVIFQDLFNRISKGDGIASKVFGAIYLAAKWLVDNLSNLFKSLINGLKNAFSDENLDANPIVNFFKAIGSAVTESNLGNSLYKALTGILTLFSKILDLIGDLGGVGENLETGIKLVIAQFVRLWNWVVDELTKLTFRDIADVALVASLASLVSSFSKIGKAVTGVIGSAAGVLDSVSDFISGFTSGGITGKINKFLENSKWLQVTAAIVVLVNGIVELGKMPNDELGRAVASIGVTLGLLIVFLKILENFAKSSTSTTDPSDVVIKLSASIGLLAVSVKIMSSLIKETDVGNDYSKLIAGIVGLGAVMAEMLGLVFILNKIGTVSGIAGTAATMLVFAVGLTAMVVPITLMSLLPLPMLAAGVAAVGATLIAFAAACALMKSVNPASILSAAVSMNLMAVALTALTIPLAIISGLIALNGLDFIWTLGTLITMMAALTIACKEIGKTSRNAIGLVAAGVAMIAFAGAITILSGAMALLTAVPWSSIGKGLAVIGVGIIGLAAAAAVAQTFAIGVALIDATILVLAGSFWIFSEGVKNFGIAVNAFGEGALKIATIIAAVMAAVEIFGPGLKDTLHQAMELIETAIKDLLKMIGGMSYEIASAASALMSGFFLGLANAAPDIIVGVLAIGTIIGSAIGEWAKPLADGLAKALDGLAEAAPMLMDALGNLIKSMLLNMGDLVQDVLGGILGGIVSIFSKDAGQIIADGTADFFDWLGDWTMEMHDWEKGIWDEFWGKENNFISKTQADWMAELTEAMFSGKPYDQDTLDAYLEGMREIGVEISDNIVLGLEEGLRTREYGAYAGGEAVGNQLIEGIRVGAGVNSPSWKAFEIGEWTVEGLLDAMKSYWPELDQTGFDTAESFLGGMLGGLDEGGETVEGALGALMHMFDNAAASIRASVNQIDADIARYEKLNQVANNRFIDTNTEMITGINKYQASNAGKTAAETFSESYNKSLSNSLGSGSSSKGGGGGSSGKAQTAAEKIVESYKSALEELDYLDKKYKGEYDLWEILNVDVDQVEKDTQKLEYTNKEIENQVKRTQIAQEKYEKIAKAMGKTSEDARNAEVDWIEQQVSLAKLQNEAIELQNSIIQNTARKLEYQEKIAQASYNLWTSSNTNASEMEKQEKLLAYNMEKLEFSAQRVSQAQDAYNEALEKYGEDSEKTKDALLDLLEAQTDYQDAATEVRNTQDGIWTMQEEQAETMLKNSTLAYEIWLETNKSASQAEKESKKLENLMSQQAAQMKKLEKATADYEKAVRDFGEDSKEAADALNIALEEQKALLEVNSNLRQVELDRIDAAKTNIELASNMNSLMDERWQMEHQGATAEERYAHNMEIAIKDATLALEEYNIAMQEYHRAVQEHGKDSEDAARAWENVITKSNAWQAAERKAQENQLIFIEDLQTRTSLEEEKAASMVSLWETVNENATQAEKHAKTNEDITRRASNAYEELMLLEQKRQYYAKVYGENSDQALQLQTEINKKYEEIAKILNERKDLTLSYLDDAASELDFEKKRLQISDEIWTLVNESASDAEKHTHNIEKITWEIVLSQRELGNLMEIYNYQVQRYGESSEQARNAWYDYYTKQKEILELQNERKELESEILEMEIERLSLAQTRAKTEYELWEALNEDATESGKQSKKLTYQMDLLEFSTTKLANSSKKYNQALQRYGEDAKETQRLFNEMLDAQLEYAQTYNELKSIQQEIITKNNDILDQLNESEQLLNYGYNMWEKLVDDISDAQKIEAEIKKLGMDLTTQVARANYYGAEWKRAVLKYGEGSAEAQEAYLNYLEALYKAVELQSNLEQREKDLVEKREADAKAIQDVWDEITAKDLVGGTSIYDELVEMGLSEAEIEAYVREKAGVIEDTIGAEMDFSIDNMQKKAEDALTEWGLTWMDGVYSVQEDVVTTASDTMAEMTKIIDDAAAEISTTAREGMEDVNDEVDKGAEKVNATATSSIDDLITAITTNSPAITEAVTGALRDVVTAASTMNYEFRTIGLSISLGIEQGIYQGRNAVVQAATSVVQEAISRVRSMAQIRSPSRVTAWIGEMLDAGLIVGIEKRAGEMAQTMAQTVQNGIRAMRNVIHTDNTLDYASRMIANGITGGLEGYSYNILAIGQSVIDDLSEEYDAMVSEMVGENQWLLDALREYGFDETTHGIEFVVNLDSEEARTELEKLFMAREDELDYYEELLYLQERNAAKDQSDLAVQAEANAIQRELNRVLAAIEASEKSIEDFVNAGRSSSYEDTIAGKKTEFVQNIYSTKPLSPLDIYRNTNSLLLKFTAWR